MTNKHFRKQKLPVLKFRPASHNRALTYSTDSTYKDTSELEQIYAYKSKAIVSSQAKILLHVTNLQTHTVDKVFETHFIFSTVHTYKPNLTDLYI